MPHWKAFVDGLPRPPRPRREHPIRLVAFDLDGVLTNQESSWVTVHEHFGVQNDASLRAFLMGEITEEEFIRRDVGLWKKQKPGITLREVERILGARLTLTRGAKTTVRQLQTAGVTCAIVSGGIASAARAVARQLGIDHVSANELHADARGRLTGRGTVHTPLRNKAVPLRRFARELGVRLEQVASVGNSSPDIGMFRSSGLAIAFRPTDAHVARAADVVVPGPSLLGILDPILHDRVREARSAAVGGI